ncbi:hypothetical protein ACFL6Y_04010, partial [Elusimicrobiota bacterium]
LKLAMFKLGKEIKDPSSGRVIGRTEEKVGEARIETFFGDDGSIAVLKKGIMPSSGDLCKLKE